MLRFALVGVACFGAQYFAAVELVRLGTIWPIANAIAFALSAQLNFGLSSVFTWGDRRTSGGKAMWIRWISYNGTVLLSLALNSATFTVSYRVVGTLPAAATGVLVGSGATFLICNFVVFRPRRTGPGVLSAADGPVRGERPAESTEVVA
jgi:putative flippase GtrA